MSLISRLYDFVSNTRIKSAEIDAELNQLVAGHNAQEEAIALKADAEDVITLTGNETINGVKNFVSSPVVPTPSNNNQAANKSYVDTTLAGAVMGLVPDGSITFSKLDSSDGEVGDLLNFLSDVAVHSDSVTITTTGWTTGSYSGYTKRLILSVPGIREGQWVNATILKSDLQKAWDMELCPTIETQDDQLWIYANAVPSSAFTVSLAIGG